MLFLSYIDMSVVIIVRRKQIMELIGNLKKKVDKASSKEEKRELIEKAGMKLNDMELEMISGGRSFQSYPFKEPKAREFENFSVKTE